MLSTLKECSEDMGERIERVTAGIIDVLCLHSENEIRIRNTMESNKRKRKRNW
jgi:hypothetical protein